LNQAGELLSGFIGVALLYYSYILNSPFNLCKILRMLAHFQAFV